MPETAIPADTEPRRSIVKAFATLTAADVQAFMVARHATQKCACCSNADPAKWKVQLPKDEGFPDLPRSEPNVTGFGTFYYRNTKDALPALAIVCQNCGWIRLHSGEVIADWKKTQPAA